VEGFVFVALPELTVIEEEPGPRLEDGQGDEEIKSADNPYKTLTASSGNPLNFKPSRIHKNRL
jgi:hypothetical protein